MRRSFRTGLVSSLVSSLAVLFALAGPPTAGAQQGERTPVPANAQPAPQNPKPAAQIQPGTSSRPKIGVALEGGGAELPDETQHGPDSKSRNCDGADRHEIDGSEPNHLSRTRIHHSQPFSGVLPRNTL